MARITPPDPDLFPTAAMRAAAWIRIVGTTPDLDPDDRFTAMEAVMEVVASPERTDFVLLRIADLAGRIRNARCECCGRPLAEDIGFISLDGEEVTIEQAIPDRVACTVIGAVLDAARGEDIDDRIRALDLNPATAIEASARVAMFDLSIQNRQPTFPR